METVRIPNRALFKPLEVCEIAQVQPYVLRSWEEEFPDLGVARAGGGPRLYRRSDLERVLRLKHLLFVEGLTLSGARRRLEEERAVGEVDDPAAGCILITADARERLERVRRGLRALMAMLGGERAVDESDPPSGERPVPQGARAAVGGRVGDNGRTRGGRSRGAAERPRRAGRGHPRARR
ncbi:MAG TPA: MerR family transcriptional regulator [Vicinamibacterales bacterium]|nr:MerR family transcriptional regulator [Vicinamibacterales bacterium]